MVQSRNIRMSVATPEHHPELEAPAAEGRSSSSCWPDASLRKELSAKTTPRQCSHLLQVAKQAGTDLFHCSVTATQARALAPASDPAAALDLLQAPAPNIVYFNFANSTDISRLNSSMPEPDKPRPPFKYGAACASYQVCLLTAEQDTYVHALSCDVSLYT